MKKILVGIWLAFLISLVGLLFWYNEWVYSLPTPVPEFYENVNLGQHIEVAGWGLDTVSDKPVFFHFFNPDCPCSRFNIPHFKSLVKQYGDQVNFVIIPITMLGKQHSEEEIRDKFELDIPILFYPEIAPSLGVYATPQAAILDSNHKLYYRGNYNRSRYCTDKKSNYAQMAIDSLLSQNTTPSFSPLALKAYGCQVPNSICRK